MRKLRLDIDALKVESFTSGEERDQADFAVVPAPLDAGTVKGNDFSAWYTGCACPAPPASEANCTGYGYPGCTVKNTFCEPSCVVGCRV